MKCSNAIPGASEFLQAWSDFENGDYAATARGLEGVEKNKAEDMEGSTKMLAIQYQQGACGLAKQRQVEMN